jgi:hypothetical protein
MLAMSAPGRRVSAIAAISLLLAQGSATAAAAQDAPKPAISPITRVAPDPNWAEEQAYTLGVQAYVF